MRASIRRHLCILLIVSLGFVALAKADILLTGAGSSIKGGGGGGGGDLLLEDGVSALLLEDGSSNLCLESGC